VRRGTHHAAPVLKLQALLDCTSLFQKYHKLFINARQSKDAMAIATTGGYFLLRSFCLRHDGAPPMTSVSSQVLSESVLHDQTPARDVPDLMALPKQDTREYLADMLRELSVIATWADLERVRTLIDAALHEIEGETGHR
jgi:hypothetical protein